MSSVIAVCVSFIGFASIIAVLVVFIQMILSFPAMLSSNSQTYIQQQRHHHQIPLPDDVFDPGYPATSAIDGADVDDVDVDVDVDGETETETEADWTEPEWTADEAVDRWIDDVDEQTSDCSSAAGSHVPVYYKTACLARGIEPITRGRPLRRGQRGKHVSRAVLRLRDDFESRSRDRVDGTRPACAPSWRNVEWAR